MQRNNSWLTAGEFHRTTACQLLRRLPVKSSIRQAQTAAGRKDQGPRKLPRLPASSAPRFPLEDISAWRQIADYRPDSPPPHAWAIVPAHTDLGIVRMRAKIQEYHSCLILLQPGLYLCTSSRQAKSPRCNALTSSSARGHIRRDGMPCTSQRRSKRNNIRLVRLRHQRVAQENNQIHFVLQPRVPRSADLLQAGRT